MRTKQATAKQHCSTLHDTPLHTRSFIDHLLLRWTEISHLSVSVFPKDWTEITVHPYRLASPSSKSSTNTLSLDLCVWFGSMRHDEKSPRVMQLFIITFSEATAVLSESLCICSDINFTSGFSVSPEHTISLRLGMFLKSREYSPENNALKNVSNHTVRRKADY